MSVFRMVVKPFPTYDDQEHAMPVRSARVCSAEKAASTISSTAVVGHAFTSMSPSAYPVYNSSRERSRSVVRQMSASPVASTAVTTPRVIPSPARCRLQVVDRRSHGPQSALSIVPPFVQAQHAPASATNADTALSNQGSVAAGNVLSINGEKYRLEKKLGQGMYGTVWSGCRCNSPDGSEVAIKLMEPSDAIDMNLAKFELAVLQQLSKKIPESSEAARHAPRYIAHSISYQKLGLDAARPSVRVVMSKISGSPLDQWLYGLDVEDQKLTPASVLLDGPLPGSKLGTFGFSEALAATTCIVKQLAMVLVPLSDSTYHRDISAHNVMVTGSGAADLQCALIDFGLAVEKQDWHQNWRNAMVSGDARYWMPAHWTITTQGAAALDSQPHTMKQYVEKLDHYALGILALEVLFALWQQPAGKYSQKDHVVHQAFKPVRSAWRVYWQQAVQLWQDAQACTSFKQLQQTMTKAQSAHHFNQSLSQLRIALRNVTSKGLATIREYSGLLKLIVDLLDEQNMISWQTAANLTLPESKNPDTPRVTPRNSFKDADSRHVSGSACLSCQEVIKPSMKSQESMKGIDVHVETVTTAPSSPSTLFEPSASISYSPTKPAPNRASTTRIGFPKVVKHTSAVLPVQSPLKSDKDHEDLENIVSQLRAEMTALRQTKDAEIVVLKAEVEQLRKALNDQRSGATRALAAVGLRDSNTVNKPDKAEKPIVKGSKARLPFRAPDKENEHY